MIPCSRCSCPERISVASRITAGFCSLSWVLQLHNRDTTHTGTAARRVLSVPRGARPRGTVIRKYGARFSARAAPALRAPVRRPLRAHPALLARVRSCRRVDSCRPRKSTASAVHQVRRRRVHISLPDSPRHLHALPCARKLYVRPREQHAGARAVGAAKRAP